MFRSKKTQKAVAIVIASLLVAAMFASLIAAIAG